MIPTIGIMIGVYIIFRCLEAMCRSASYFGSPRRQQFIWVMAIIVMLVTGFLALDLIMAGNPEPLRSLSGPISPTKSSPAPSAYGASEIQTTQYMRGLGFTAEETAKAMNAATSADRVLGSQFDVLQRMAQIALSGSIDERELRSIGTDFPSMREVMGVKTDSDVVKAFPYENAEERLSALYAAMKVGK